MARDFRRFLVVAACLLALGHVVQHTAFARQVRIGAFELMQGRLSSVSPNDSIGVVIVSLDGLAPVTVQDGSRDLVPVTPRGPLLDLIKTIASHQPRAIGIDVDFSPELGAFQTPDDPMFFEAIRVLDETVRIRLGIERTRGRPREEWLGDPNFVALAASIVVPYPDEGTVVRRMPLSFALEGRDGLAGLAAALVAQPPPEPPAWLTPFVHLRSDATCSGETEASCGTQFLVDFSRVDQLLDTALPSSGISAVADQRARLKDRYVLVGDIDTSRSRDRFSLPGKDRAYPGVLVHAAAVYTLTEAPLYELTEFGGLVIDVLLALLAFLAVASVRLWFASRVREEVDAHRLTLVAMTAMMVLLLLLGHYAVASLRIVWLGYALAILLLLVHLVASRTLDADHAGTKRTSWVRAFLFRERRG